MNAVMKDSFTVEPAIGPFPKGQSPNSGSTLSKRRKAMLDMPERANHRIPSDAPIAVAARPSVPKGHRETAAQQPNEGDRDKEPVPKSQSSHSRRLPPHSAAAIPISPKGHKSSAAQNPLNDEADNSFVPLGQEDDSASSSPIASEDVIPHVPEGQRAGSSSLAPLIDSLREFHRRRQDLQRAEVKLTLQIKAICRRISGGELKDAQKLHASLIAGDESERACLARMITQPYFRAQEPLQAERAVVEKDAARFAKMLPIAVWVNGIKGFGIASLAAVIGEAGDLSNYPTHSHLWKRLGLAVIDGERQQRKSGPLALIHGYSPSRRSVIWNIGQCVFKAQSARVDKETGEVKAEAGEYRRLYDARKAYELPRCEAIAADPEQRKRYGGPEGKYAPKAHAHNRAVRYIEKKLMRDLWRAWRRIETGVAAP